jgi:diacylglycerol kinase (ATP)
MTESTEICVIFNPAAGKGRAANLVRAAQKSIHAPAVLRPSRTIGHAAELAQEAANEGFPLVVAAGGDGTVHEVANGLLQANRPDVCFGIWPIGSANDYAFALGLTEWWRGDRGRALMESQVDVGRIAGGGRSRYFVNGMGLGFNGAVTLESRHIKRLQGMALYGLATLKAIVRHFGQPTLRVRFDDVVREKPTLALSVNLGPREGNFPVTPEAKLDDGLFDCIQAGPLTRWGAIKLLPRMATGTLPSDHPHLWLGRCRSVHIQASQPVRVHLDGEFFCHPEDGIQEFSIELIPRRLRVQHFVGSGALAGSGSDLGAATESILATRA